jgi:hypothetical protein
MILSSTTKLIYNMLAFHQENPTLTILDNFIKFRQGMQIVHRRIKFSRMGSHFRESITIILQGYNHIQSFRIMLHRHLYL